MYLVFHPLGLGLDKVLFDWNAVSDPMFSVFNTNLQTDMGKTIVRKHLASTDAQAVWKELSEHMKTSSKGASEKRRLTQYVTNTVLDDNIKGTTEQFVLHFNEQFRQLEEISEDDERLPPSVKLITNLNILLDAPPEDCGSYTEISSVLTANLHHSSPQEPDWNALRPFFAWTSPSSIKDTFNVTTRHGTAPHTQDYIKKHFKSRNPVFNIPRRSEAVATDTIFSDTPAVDDGSTMAQFLCGRDTLVCDAYGIKSTKQFINTLSDNIRKQGAMDILISDGGNYEISQ